MVKGRNSFPYSSKRRAEVVSCSLHTGLHWKVSREVMRVERGWCVTMAITLNMFTTRTAFRSGSTRWLTTFDSRGIVCASTRQFFSYDIIVTVSIQRERQEWHDRFNTAEKPLFRGILHPDEALFVSLLRNNENNGYPGVVMSRKRRNDADNGGANSTKIDNTRYPTYNPGMASLLVVDD